MLGVSCRTLIATDTLGFAPTTGTPPALAHPRSSRPAPPPADIAQHDCLELRPIGKRRAAVIQVSLGLRRRLHLGGSAGNLSAGYNQSLLFRTVGRWSRPRTIGTTVG